MIFKHPPHWGRCSISMSKTRWSTRAQLIRVGVPCGWRGRGPRTARRCMNSSGGLTTRVVSSRPLHGSNPATTSRHPRDDLTGQMRGALRHTPRATGGAKPAPLARQRHRLLMRAPGAAQPQEAVSQNPAFEKGIELVLHELGQRRSGLCLDLS